MNDSELFLCPGAAFSHLRTSPTCDMMGTTKVSEKPHDRGKKRGKSDDAKESIKENMIMAREIINTEKSTGSNRTLCTGSRRQRPFIYFRTAWL